jgi:hypothetical protein
LAYFELLRFQEPLLSNSTNQWGFQRVYADKGFGTGQDGSSLSIEKNKVKKFGKTCNTATLVIAIAPFPLLIKSSGEIVSLEKISYSSRIDDWNTSFFFGIWQNEFS